MGLVRGCGINCTPCRRRGRGVGYLLCLNQVTHPPTRTSRPDPFIPRSITTLTRWEPSLLILPLVTMDVGGVEWGRIGGNGTMETMRTRARTRWKPVSFWFLVSLCALGCFIVGCFISDGRFPRRCLCDSARDCVYVRRALTWEPEKDHTTPFGILSQLPPSSPCMTRAHPPPRPPRPFPHNLSVWASELLTAFTFFSLSLFFVSIYFPLAMLYHSQVRVVTDTLYSVKLELPPAKRRKGLTGSIVSTALSAALIGTAVGLTMYRL